MPVEAFATLMHTQDLSTFRPRAPPETDAKNEQKQLSATSHMKWWYGVLDSGVIGGRNRIGEVARQCVGVRELYDDYVKVVSQLGERHPKPAQTFGKEMVKLCGKYKLVGANGKDIRKTFEGVQQVTYEFPSLDDLRAEFGVKVPTSDAAVQQSPKTYEPGPPPYTETAALQHPKLATPPTHGLTLEQISITAAFFKAVSQTSDTKGSTCDSHHQRLQAFLS